MKNVLDAASAMKFVRRVQLNTIRLKNSAVLAAENVQKFVQRVQFHI